MIFYKAYSTIQDVGDLMTRMFLLGSVVALSISTWSAADTLVDVFDDSLDSQVMNVSATEIEELLGTTGEDLGESVSSTRPRFLLASFRIDGKRTGSDRYLHWTPGNYPLGMMSLDACFTADPDEHFYYFAADLDKLDDKTKAYDFRNAFGSRPAAQHLEKLPRKNLPRRNLPRNLTRSAKR